MTSLRIRTAAAADSEAIAPLLGQLGYPTRADAIPTRLASIEREEGIVLVAVNERDHIVGVASGAVHVPLHADELVAYITSLVTDAEARGQGVGRALVAELERWATDMGCARLSVTSAEHRADAHAFYPACGFPYTGRRYSKSLTAASAGA